jgi:hypothetical protein
MPATSTRITNCKLLIHYFLNKEDTATLCELIVAIIKPEKAFNKFVEKRRLFVMQTKQFIIFYYSFNNEIDL